MLVYQCSRTLKYNIKYIVTYCCAGDICVIFLTALEVGGRRSRCNLKKVKVHAEDIDPHRSPDVSLLEVCVPLDTVSYSPTVAF
jgi:hypothetical protein